MADQERIVAVAIDLDGLVVSLAAPARHHNVFARLSNVVSSAVDYTHMLRQGFLTSGGRFVDRYAAAVIAKAAGQVRGGEPIATCLTSEDLW